MTRNRIEELINWLKAPEETFLSSVWENVEQVWQEFMSAKREILCQLSCLIHYKHENEGIFKGMTWCELVVDKAKNLFVQQFHEVLQKKLLSLGIHCLNKSGEYYHPYITLFNSLTKLLPAALINEIPDDDGLLLKPFPVIPALGIANDNWELIEKIRQ